VNIENGGVPICPPSFLPTCKLANLLQTCAPCEPASEAFLRTGKLPAHRQTSCAPASDANLPTCKPG
jgi:hypothetical protein